MLYTMNKRRPGPVLVNIFYIYRIYINLLKSEAWYICVGIIIEFKCFLKLFPLNSVNVINSYWYVCMLWYRRVDGYSVCILGYRRVDGYSVHILGYWRVDVYTVCILGYRRVYGYTVCKLGYRRVDG